MNILAKIRKSISDHYKDAIDEGRKATTEECIELVGALAICMMDIADSCGMPDDIVLELLSTAKLVVLKNSKKPRPIDPLAN